MDKNDTDEFDARAELVYKAARMLVGCQKVIPDARAEDHVLLVGHAVAVFEGMGRDEALRFLRANWAVIEQSAFALDVQRDIDRLDAEDRPDE